MKAIFKVSLYLLNYFVSTFNLTYPLNIHLQFPLPISQHLRKETKITKRKQCKIDVFT